MELPKDLIGQLRAAGAEHVQEAAPDVVDLGVLRSWCERDERILRLQYEDGKLPDPYEGELAGMPAPTTTSDALRRWALLKHVFRVRSEGQPRATAGGARVEDTVRKILRREPVPVELLGRIVNVTSRSYGAMLEIARASLAIDQLEGDLRTAVREELKLRGDRQALPLLSIRERRALQRQIGDLRGLAVRIRIEQQWHRMSIYAHALTPSGAPAKDVQAEAPAWWEEMGPAEDAVLLAALWEAGPIRYSELGRPPQSDPRKKGAQSSEDFGWGNLFAAWESEMGIEPGELYNRDLVQLLVQLRARATNLPD